MPPEFSTMGRAGADRTGKPMEPLEHKAQGTVPKSGAPAAAKGAVPEALDPELAGGEGLALILDVPLEISVELGRTRLLVCDLLKLHQGSVIELSKVAGETLDILANQRMIARGEVVVTNEKYGVRLTEVITPAERIEKLG